MLALLASVFGETAATYVDAAAARAVLRELGADDDEVKAWLAADDGRLPS